MMASEAPQPLPVIPQQLTLKNFLSYRQATLDFRGLHTACICGPNGAGKSSLLEAITWALWGECRAPSADDVIRSGCTEARVDFSFQSGGQTYRVIRVRRRGYTALEFQIWAEGRWQPLTQRSVRETQDYINRELKLDYHTFIHSAYLRQGRADEFMLKTPAKRKEVLASLLQLEHYDALAEEAKKRASAHELQVQHLRETLRQYAQTLAQEPDIRRQYQQLQQDLQAQQATCERLQQEYQHSQQRQQQRQQWLQQYEWLQQQRAHLLAGQQQLQQRRQQLQQRQQALEHLLHQAEAITAQYHIYCDLQQQEEACTQKAHQHQHLQQELNRLERDYQQALHQLHLQQRQLETEIATLQENCQKQAAICQEKDRLGPALAQLQKARAYLQELDRRAEQYRPLYDHYQHLQRQQLQVRARQEAQRQEYQQQLQRLQHQWQSLAYLDQELAQIQQQLTELDKKEVYLKHVEDKGKERKSFQDQLKARLQSYEAEMAKLQQKMALLQEPEAVCPLCAQPLDPEHWQLVHQKQALERRELEEAIWLTKEQITVTEREIEVLRQEYREVSSQLKARESLHQKQGQLHQQIHHRQQLQEQMAELAAQVQALEQALAQPLTSPEMDQIQAALDVLGYDEKEHACARAEVDKWRWVEIKQAEIQNAENAYADLSRQLTNARQRQQALAQEIEQLAQDSPLRYALDRCRQQLAAVAYDSIAHQALRQRLKQYESAPLQYRELQNAQQEYPRLQAELAELTAQETAQAQQLQHLTLQLEQLEATLADFPDLQDTLQTLETELHRQRQHLQNQYVESGKLQEQLHQLAQLREKYQQAQRDLAQQEHHYQVYQALTQAFGKNGIQALMIEQVLPQLEATANHILGRLTNHQLHVSFVTQKPKKTGNHRDQMIETLDIFIADAQGTRPYETYSGGEAFRVNFAIRLALARLLTQRAGATLQMLIIDEGFGTQDAQGCDRLLAAISAIADEYACVLVVTHIPSLKEAFPARIEVSKTEAGSQAQLVV
ncbi:MAG: SMC family ATPase [Gloeomargarita sp. SKYBB_i_bin120]|nr:SMC family ATPase [Gloeomargarita sp. SKYG98]MCS7291644.1 SMC family ATPase [Gloeomargarita sp. SKYB120]MDW8177203.1 SMC family ATPase [Gloeomargarita sp. SKYBB_i_bin120]